MVDQVKQVDPEEYVILRDSEGKAFVRSGKKASAPAALASPAPVEAPKPKKKGLFK